MDTIDFIIEPEREKEADMMNRLYYWMWKSIEIKSFVSIVVYFVDFMIIAGMMGNDRKG